MLAWLLNLGFAGGDTRKKVSLRARFYSTVSLKARFYS